MQLERQRFLLLFQTLWLDLQTQHLMLVMNSPQTVLQLVPILQVQSCTTMVLVELLSLATHGSHMTELL